MVSIQVVRQEPDPAFQRHGQRPQRQRLPLRRRKGGAGPQEAPGENTEQLQIHFHFAQIFLVLRRCGRAEADGIAEIVGAESRHGGIQIDDAQGRVGLFIQHHIVELGIVVGHPQGEHTGLEHFRQPGSYLLMGQCKGNFLFHRSGPSHGIPGDGLPENPEPVRGVVEVADGFVKGFRRETAELLLEGAEGDGALIQILGAPGGLKADAPLNEIKYPPITVRAVMIPVLSIQGEHQRQGGIGVFQNPVEIPGDGCDVLLKTRHIREGPAADPLKNITFPVPCLHQIGFVDMAAAIAAAALYTALREKP